MGYCASAPDASLGDEFRKLGVAARLAGLALAALRRTLLAGATRLLDFVGLHRAPSLPSSLLSSFGIENRERHHLAGLVAGAKRPLKIRRLGRRDLREGMLVRRHDDHLLSRLILVSHAHGEVYSLSKNCSSCSPQGRYFGHKPHAPMGYSLTHSPSTTSTARSMPDRIFLLFTPL
jgi:hypothetical protein